MNGSTRFLNIFKQNYMSYYNTCIRMVHGCASENKTCVILTGLGMSIKHASKHCRLYESHGFNVVPIVQRNKQLVTPKLIIRQGEELAEMLMQQNQPVIIHSISVSFYTMLEILSNMDENWRERYIKLIVLDSSPCLPDICSLNGLLKELYDSHHLTRYYMLCLYKHYYELLTYASITEDIRQAWYRKSFGSTSVIPTKSNLLLLYGKNDQVLNHNFLEKFIIDAKRNRSKEARVDIKKFDSTRHAMAIVDYPDTYYSELSWILYNTFPELRFRKNQQKN